MQPRRHHEHLPPHPEDESPHSWLSYGLIEGVVGLCKFNVPWLPSFQSCERWVERQPWWIICWMSFFAISGAWRTKSVSNGECSIFVVDIPHNSPRNPPNPPRVSFMGILKGKSKRTVIGSEQNFLLQSGGCHFWFIEWHLPYLSPLGALPDPLCWCQRTLIGQLECVASIPPNWHFSDTPFALQKKSSSAGPWGFSTPYPHPP